MCVKLNTMRTGVLLYHGVSEFEVAQFMTIAATAKLYAPETEIELFTLARTRLSVVAAAGMVITPGSAFTASPPELDVLFVPGGSGSEKASKDSQTKNYLRGVVPQLKNVYCLSGGALLLGEAQCIKDLKVATWPGLVETIWKYDPKEVLNEGMTENKNGIFFASHSGLMNALALRFVEQYFSADVAKKVRQHLLIG